MSNKHFSQESLLNYLAEIDAVKPETSNSQLRILIDFIKISTNDFPYHVVTTKSSGAGKLQVRSFDLTKPTAKLEQTVYHYITKKIPAEKLKAFLNTVSSIFNSEPNTLNSRCEEILFNTFLMSYVSEIEMFPTSLMTKISQHRMQRRNEKGLAISIVSGLKGTTQMYYTSTTGWRTVADQKTFLSNLFSTGEHMYGFLKFGGITKILMLNAAFIGLLYELPSKEEIIEDNFDMRKKLGMAVKSSDVSKEVKSVELYLEALDDTLKHIYKPAKESKALRIVPIFPTPVKVEAEKADPAASLQVEDSHLNQPRTVKKRGRPVKVKV